MTQIWKKETEKHIEQATLITIVILGVGFAFGVLPLALMISGGITMALVGIVLFGILATSVAGIFAYKVIAGVNVKRAFKLWFLGGIISAIVGVLLNLIGKPLGLSVAVGIISSYVGVFAAVHYLNGKKK